jgi:hypothetical protein
MQNLSQNIIKRRKAGQEIYGVFQVKKHYIILYSLHRDPLHGNLKAYIYTVLNHSATVFQKSIIWQVSEIVHRLVEMWD